MNYYLARSLPYWFHRAGVAVTLASNPRFPVARSRYVSRVEPASLEPAERADTLYNLALRGDYGPILLTSEHIVEHLAQTPERLTAVTGASPAFAAACASRSHLMQWAEETGLPVAPGRVCNSANEAAEAVNQLGRIFLKFDHSSGGEGVVDIDTPEQARAAWERRPNARRAVAQAYVPGPTGMTEILACRGRLLAWNCSTKLRTTRRNGPSCARESCALPGMDELARRFAEACGATGMFGFDWILDERRGEAAIIEMQCRVTSGLSFFAQCGVPLDTVLRELALGGADRPPLGPAESVRRSFYFPEHLIYVARHRHWGDLRHWTPFSDARSWANIPWGDPLPECANLARRIRGVLRPKSQATASMPRQTTVTTQALQRKV